MLNPTYFLVLRSPSHSLEARCLNQSFFLYKKAELFTDVCFRILLYLIVRKNVTGAKHKNVFFCFVVFSKYFD